MNTLFLALAAAYAVTASAFDLRSRIIPNWLSYGAFGVALALAFALQALSPPFAIFVALAFGFAYLLYRLGAWAGGDVKFFAALAAWFALLHPPDPLSLLIAFLASAALIMPVALVAYWPKVISERKKLKEIASHSARSSLSGAAWAGALAVVSTFGWYALAAGVIAAFVLSRFWQAAVLASLAALAVSPTGFLSSFAASALILFLAFFFLKSFFSLVPVIFRRQVPVSQLKEGDIPAVSVYVNHGKTTYWEPPSLANVLQAAKRLDANAIQARLSPPPGRKIADCLAARGLLPSEIRELKKVGVRALMIKESMPFAPAIALGFAVALLL